jgi:hypothetical protein
MSGLNDFFRSIGFEPDEPTTDLGELAVNGFERFDTPNGFRFDPPDPAESVSGSVVVDSAAAAFEMQESSALLMISHGVRLPAFLAKLTLPLRARALTYIDQVLLERTGSHLQPELFGYLLTGPEVVAHTMEVGSAMSKRFFVMAGALATAEITMWDDARRQRVTTAIESLVNDGATPIL